MHAEGRNQFKNYTIDSGKTLISLRTLIPFTHYHRDTLDGVQLASSLCHGYLAM